MQQKQGDINKEVHISDTTHVQLETLYETLCLCFSMVRFVTGVTHLPEEDWSLLLFPASLETPGEDRSFHNSPG